MTRRNYGQSCGIARALDLLGERWTLLLIRDLLTAPRRYTDLLEGLPGIGTNLLADRLKLLESEGLIRRRNLPPPTDSVTVYELTSAGRELEAVLQSLVRWSWRNLGVPDEGTFTDPRWTILALRAAFSPDAAVGIDATYEFRISGTKIWAQIHDGTIHTGLGSVEDPQVVLEGDDRTLAMIRSGGITVEKAIEANRLAIQGEAGAIERMLRLFSRR